MPCHATPCHAGSTAPALRASGPYRHPQCLCHHLRQPTLVCTQHGAASCGPGQPTSSPHRHGEHREAGEGGWPEPRQCAVATGRGANTGTTLAGIRTPPFPPPLCTPMQRAPLAPWQAQYAFACETAAWQHVGRAVRRMGAAPRARIAVLDVGLAGHRVQPCPGAVAQCAERCCRDEVLQI